MKWKVLPPPSSLSTHTRPPINSTSADEMASPSPVPPKRRVVDVSACSKALKMSSCLSLRDADARVAHRKVQRHAARGRARWRLTVITTSP